MTRGRHTPGRHAAGRQIADQPWERSSVPGVWRAYRNGLTLTVTHLVGGGWEAGVEGPGVEERSEVIGTRARAQLHAERVADERRRDS